ncbi:MAG: SDR family NAD(P)-dependent oxidoreductase [Bacteroidales bacterium]
MNSINMRHVIITGGSRGIGFGLMREFLRLNYRVTFTGTTDATVNSAAEKLGEEFNTGNFRGMVCDVTIIDDLRTLWEFSTSIFGPVDIFINNAGLSNRTMSFNQLETDEFIRVVDVNIKGVMQATHLAFNRMSEQGHGAIYNMGGGSDGRMIKGPGSRDVKEGSPVSQRPLPV